MATRKIDIAPDHAYNNSSSSSSSEEVNEKTDLKDEIEDYKKILLFSLQWLKDISTLANIELKLSTKAIIQCVLLKIYIIPCLILFYISVFVSAAYLTYYYTQSAIYTVVVLLSIQIITLMSLHIYSKNLNKLISFKRTSKHIYEAKNDIVNAIK